MNEPRVIDVEARALLRTRNFQPGYARRTAQDLQGRPVHRPNDYRPADWWDRHQEAADRLKVRTAAVKSEPPPETGRTQAFETSLIQCLQAIKNGAQIINDVAEGFDVGLERVRDFLTEAHRRGLLTKTLQYRNGKGFNLWALTDAGAAALSGAGQ